jgi:hypothetical protein
MMTSHPALNRTWAQENDSSEKVRESGRRRREAHSTMATKECRKGEVLLGAYIGALRALRERKTVLTGPARSSPVKSIRVWLMKLEVAVRKVRDARRAFWNHSKKHGCYRKHKS